MYHYTCVAKYFCMSVEVPNGAQRAQDLAVEGLGVWKRRTIALIMIMIAFITIKSSLVPLIEGLCAQI